MNLNAALAALRLMSAPIVRTNDAAVQWNTSPATASTMLKRLADVGHILRLTRGVWLIERTANPWSLHPYLTEPAPSYISLQTALFHHGMIEQIPSTIHVVSTRKTNTLRTPVGVFSIHQVATDFFTGFEPMSDIFSKIALPEKALVDFCYFRPARSKAFRSLPEIEIPRTFRIKLVQQFINLIGAAPRREMVKDEIRKLLR